MLIEVTEVYVSQSLESGLRLRKAIYSEHAFHRVVAWNGVNAGNEAKGKLILKDGSEQLILEAPEELLLKAKGFDPKSMQGMMDTVLGALFPKPAAAPEDVACPKQDCKYWGDEDVCRACNDSDHYRKAPAFCQCGEVEVSLLGPSCSTYTDPDRGTHTRFKDNVCSPDRQPGGTRFLSVSHVCPHCQRKHHAAAGVSVCFSCTFKGLK